MCFNITCGIAKLRSCISPRDISYEERTIVERMYTRATSTSFYGLLYFQCTLERVLFEASVLVYTVHGGLVKQSSQDDLISKVKRQNQSLTGTKTNCQNKLRDKIKVE